MDSSLPKKPKDIPRPGQQNPKPNEALSPSDVPWPKWGVEPMTDEEVKALLGKILDIQTSTDANAIFAVYDFPLIEDLEKIDIKKLCNNLADQPNVYEEVGNMLGWKVRDTKG